MNELLPCPFCGCREITQAQREFNTYIEYTVECMNCNSLARHHYFNIAEFRWNERALPPDIDGYLRISPESKKWLAEPMED